jgi:hypothetical protein
MMIQTENTLGHITMGYIRDDGDFAVIATINNNDGHFVNACLFDMIGDMVKRICDMGETPYVIADGKAYYYKSSDRLKESKSFKVNTSPLQVDYLEVVS